MTAASMGVAVAAVVCGVLVLSRTRSVRRSLPVLLDLLLAAGLLRLAAGPSWTELGVAGVVVAVRGVVVLRR